MTPAEFWDRVARGEPDACWEWKLSRNEKGYGIVWFRPERSERAHRIAWELSGGEPVPPGLTKLDNMLDMDRKGRRKAGLPGERNFMARLTAKQAMDVRAHWLLCRTTKAALAERFGVSRSTVRNVINNRSHRC